MDTLNLGNTSADRRERFTVILAGKFEAPEFAAAVARSGANRGLSPENRTPRRYAEAFVSGLIDGSADHSGAAVQGTCRALGIGKSFKALRAYLSDLAWRGGK